MTERSTDRDTSWLVVPGWLAVMILSPLVGMVVALLIDGAQGGIIGAIVAATGTSAGAALPHGSLRVRLIRGLGGVVLGFCGFGLVLLGIFVLTPLLK